MAGGSDLSGGNGAPGRFAGTILPATRSRSIRELGGGANWATGRPCSVMTIVSPSLTRWIAFDGFWRSSRMPTLDMVYIVVQLTALWRPAGHLRRYGESCGVVTLFRRSRPGQPPGMTLRVRGAKRRSDTTRLAVLAKRHHSPFRTSPPLRSLPCSRRRRGPAGPGAG